MGGKVKITHYFAQIGAYWPAHGRPTDFATEAPTTSS
jgi:hypothetical protein